MDCSNWPVMWNSLSQCKENHIIDVGSSDSVNTALCLNSRCIVVPDNNYSGCSIRNVNGESPSLSSEISLVLELGSCVFTPALTGLRDANEPSQLDSCMDFDLNVGTKRSSEEVRNINSCLASLEQESPKIDLELSLSATGVTESDVTSVTQASSLTQNGVDIPASSDIVQLVDEGSTSSKWKKGLFLSFLEGIQTAEGVMPSENAVSLVSHLPSTISEPSKSLDGIGTSLSKPPRRSTVKTCQFPGCEKGARGASGHCISHGGGRRCQRLGCQKGAEGKTVFCKAHGGGRRCEHLGCTKSAEGRTNFCISHGGGKRCTFHGGCTRAARGRSGLCIRHGGGKRCKIENCTKSAEGLAGLCIAHGGGRRCQFPECTKGAQGSTKFCKAHGGGKRCTFLGCTKGAEGSTSFCKAHGGGKRCTFQGGGVCSKSVHGGTLFCVSHGGGKRCAVQGCTKSARGRTSFCVRHGGGKRCMYDGCGKSAQGSTDFCKAHGGGKRCLWGQVGSCFGVGGDTRCDKFARGKIGLCAAHTAQIQDKRVHGNGTVGLLLKETAFTNNNNPVSEGNLSDRNGFELGRRDENLMPTQLASEHGTTLTVGALPEGRVHGGGLMAMLRGGIGVGHAGANLR